MDRMLRAREDRRLAGVCAGLGRRFRIDPGVFRAGFVALSLLWGLGLPLYWVFCRMMKPEVKEYVEHETGEIAPADAPDR